VRSYGQFCSVARALDVIGDRWTLLIVRELLEQGPCRYTDLQNGLPGIATNLLSERLRQLEAAGIVERRNEPAPIATTLFSLTEDGRELRPVLHALGIWGARFMVSPAGSDAFRPHWFRFPVSLFLEDSEPGGEPVRMELRTPEGSLLVESRGGTIETRAVDGAEAPDLVLEGDPQMILGVIAGFLTLRDARAGGLRTTGKVEVLRRLLRAQPLAEKLEVVG
jgi:DNA-binding HxlR family transcriptional regulator